MTCHDTTDITSRRAHGAVYKASFRDTGYQVAAKKIEFEDNDSIDDVKKEIDILKKCNHANIVNYFGCVISHNESQRTLWVGVALYLLHKCRCSWITALEDL